MRRDSRRGRSKSARETKRTVRGKHEEPPSGASVPPPSPERVEPESLLLFGVPFHNVTESETLDWIVQRARAGKACQIVTSNLDFVREAWRDPEMHRIHLEADLVVADGMPPVWFSRFFGPPLRERVAGSDLVPRLARVARDRGLSLYAVGAAPGVAEKALRLLQERNPGLRVQGWESPPMAPLLQMDHDAILANVRKARPDILLVAFGAPKQDKWIRLHQQGWEVPVAIGIGGSLDFLVGTQVRAPVWLQRIGLEWFWRLAGQPRRLFGRYSRDLAFLLSVLGKLLWIRMFQPAWRSAGPPDLEPSRLASLGAQPATFRPLRTTADAAAFLRGHERTARSSSLVADLSGFEWLNSLELGTLLRLARTCRQRGRRLFAFNPSAKVRRLLLLFRLEGYIEIPSSLPELMEELRRLNDAARDGGVRLNRHHHRLQVLLPEEFGTEAAGRTKEAFLKHWQSGSVREVVIDAGRMEYLDTAGARFLDETRRLVEQESGRSMWLLGFPQSLLATMRRDGLTSVKLDRRKRFRTEDDR